MLENKDACISSVTSLDIQALNFHNLDFWDGGIMCISGTESDSHRQLQIKCPSKYANEKFLSFDSVDTLWVALRLYS